MDYIKIPRSIIYKDRTDLKDFGVKVPGTMNHQLFSNLKELFKATDRAKELILRCLNNAYYICTIIPFDDFPDTQVAEYEKLLLKDDPYDREEICAVSMAMVCKLLPASDARWIPENSDLIEQIRYRFTHYQWMHSGARNSFEFMVEKHNTDELIISPSEFVPRDIIEVIENCSERDLQVNAEYICERLALMKDQRQRMYGADMAIARIKDYQRELCEDSGYSPKKDRFKYEDNNCFVSDLTWENSVRSNYQQSKEAIDYYKEHYPTKEVNDSKEETVEIPQAPETDVLQATIRELESKLNHQEKQLLEANDINSQQATRIKELEAEVKNLQNRLEEAHIIPDTVTAQQRVRMELARIIMAAAGIDEEILAKWGNKDKAGTLMGTMLDIRPSTCKTYLSDPCMNYEHHKNTIDKINPLLEALELEFKL
jgi:uncharacterized coiled-coil protein SlyX